MFCFRVRRAVVFAGFGHGAAHGGGVNGRRGGSGGRRALCERAGPWTILVTCERRDSGGHTAGYTGSEHCA